MLGNRLVWLGLVVMVALSCARSAPPAATDALPSTSTDSAAPDEAPSPAPASASTPDRPPTPGRSATLTPLLELAASLPWGTAGLADPRQNEPGRRHSALRRVPTLATLRDGTLWLQTDSFSAVLVKRGSARHLSFTGAGLEWYLDEAPLRRGVLLLGRSSSGPELVRLDETGAVRERRHLPEPATGPPLTAYQLLHDVATEQVYLWTASDRRLRRLDRHFAPLEPPLAVSAPSDGTQWWIHDGRVEWISADDASDPPELELHSAPVDGSAATSVTLDLSRPTGPYDPVRTYGGLDLRNELRSYRGQLPEGIRLFANSALVWVRPDGTAALSLPFESVVRAGDGVAVAVTESTPALAERIERWVAGRKVAVVHPEERSASSTKLLSADANGFELYVENPYACMPDSGGLPNRIDAFLWTGPQPVRREPVACSEATFDELSDRGGAVLSRATTAPDGSVLVPGADREGVFIVRVRTAPSP